ncbi:MAG: glucosamine-6-phosphate isomerase [Prolixibacteraceae bacterium]|jgi:glucosamine-6-phosphate deaminase|nr:glucosamine-6-phosphate isomerase [Prolixibacteraceae bacterium]MBT6006039.1 glucosamine-6-phosphate isomerase [Prolixibacteraceae bacterium]MBT6763269.1 glucosamine-6-phosphate isomerase [Prolixibacteraceae bacterium]MBT6999177.1 glucosamine-6-phosphate isomerase [Prolixibacteraceae bacterium]MBT7395247.1 glucosamine-6-phosphate isomerase [Prolixibacteraceae bacterium]
MRVNFSKVEQAFFEETGLTKISTRIPYISVESFPKLGLLSALSFIEWAGENPTGVVSLPTGKTAQYFLRFTDLIMENWNNKKGKEILDKYGLEKTKKPNLSELQFVQMGEFYPISPEQHNSLFNFVEKYYIEGFGLNKNSSLLINSDKIKLAANKHFSEVFPDYKIDLTLRYREAKSHLEQLQQKSIFKIDNWCSDYESQIREKGGVGFYLGGIGPDGHVAFNTRGSDHFSTTRLTKTNFETQAITAADLGGIEVSKNRLVITIGLGTIGFNPDNKAIIYAAGEAIAGTIKKSLENEASVTYPASSFHRLKNSRFYLTDGAAVKLDDSVECFYNCGEWSHQKTERAVIELCEKINKFGRKLELEDLKADKYCRRIPDLNENSVQTVIDSILAKIEKGMQKDTNQVIYHTGPHHDDIMLGIMPVTNRQSRETSNELHFSVLTSGFTAVTNKFLYDLLIDTKDLMNQGKIEMVDYPDFFKDGYKYKWDKDIYHYLDNIAAQDKEEKRRGVCHRAIRALVSIWKTKDKEELRDAIYEVLSSLKNSYDGSKNPPKIQKLKGMIREMEEELVWAHFGIMVKNVHHLRLGFYQSDAFASKPDMEKDVLPILNEFRKYKPNTISLAMDPQGSGPDTHYKVLQAIARAVEEWKKEEDLSNLRIIGYRNVWFRYNPWDVEVIVPVTLNSLATMDKSFSECYVTQVNASFPSYQHDGKFSELTQRVWLEQHKQIQLLLGKNFFFQNKSPLLRATHGFVYIRDLNTDQFLEEAFSLEKSMEGIF